jgi:hypothetical protein
MRWRLSIIVWACLSGVACVSSSTRPVSDDELLNYAVAPYDKNHIQLQKSWLGLNNGTPVISEFICSDLCPHYTVRVIHYELERDKSCAAAGGIEKAIRIPVSRATMNKVFCFPKVLADNWEKYRK